MVKIDLNKELSLYNLEGKWNDYIGIQKEILQVLRSEKFFNNNDVINVKSGLCIRLNTKGIKETLGTGKRFQALPKRLKERKIATMRHMKSIIENAELIADNIENVHSTNGDMFIYMHSKILIDGEEVCIRIAIRKKVSVNWFWIHHIDENKKSSKLLDPSDKMELKEI